MRGALNGLLCLLLGGFGLIALVAVLHSIGIPGWPINASTLFPVLPLWVVALVSLVSLLASAWFGLRFRKEQESE